MTVFESKETINKSVSEVYAFLSDFNNHKGLMPEEISDWKSTTDQASFSVKNMANLNVKIAERKENEDILILPAQEVPFNVEMRWKLRPAGEHATEAHLVIGAELNMMMKMVAGGAIKKLTQQQTSRLKDALG